MNNDWMERARLWTQAPFDQETQRAVKRLIERDPEQGEDSFYTDLEFGTGGIRGIMGPGTNRINRYTIGMATQGLSNYLVKHFDDEAKVAIAYDSRNQSEVFARVAAEVFSANGIHVYLFENLRPTPQLSFAIRHLGCKAGVVVTASHNPPEYNGYKVYWEDGGQIVPPHDKNIIAEVRSIQDIGQVNFEGDLNRIELVGTSLDLAYSKVLMAQRPNPGVARRQSDMSIVYTALHGTGITHIPQALREMGFRRVHVVPHQDIPDGDFPTVESPNPEEASAMELGLRMARKVNADILLGTDPDADRVGVACRRSDGSFGLMNGNEAGSLLVYYCLKQLKDKGVLTRDHFVAKTIVTSELIKEIADGFGVPCANTLTGFKWIASEIKSREGKQKFVAGGEESYGYLIGDQVRDKDAVASSLVLCEVAAWAREQGKTLFDLLEEVHREFGCYRERLISLKRGGIAGKAEIAAMMDRLRNDTPDSFGGERVVAVADVQKGTHRDLETGAETPLGLPASNVFQCFTADGAKITARPSGTEPKIKFYISVRETVGDQDYNEVCQSLEGRIDRIAEDLKVLQGSPA